MCWWDGDKGIMIIRLRRFEGGVYFICLRRVFYIWFLMLMIAMLFFIRSNFMYLLTF